MWLESSINQKSLLNKPELSLRRLTRIIWNLVNCSFIPHKFWTFSKGDGIDSPSGISTKGALTEEQRQQLKMQADMLVEQGDFDETQSLYDEALTVYNDALEIYSKVKDARGIIKVYLRIANIHYHVGNLD